jgi:outer membrane protein TolC
LAPLSAQPLSLKKAVQLALRQNRSIRAAGASMRARSTDRGGSQRFPAPSELVEIVYPRRQSRVRIFFALNQHQFGAGQFRLGPLNRLHALNDFQLQVSVDQTIYDAGQTRHTVHAVEIGQRVSGEDERRALIETIAGVAQPCLAPRI